MTDKKTGFDKFLEYFPDLDLKEELTNAILIKALDIPFEMIISEKEAIMLSEEFKKIEI